MSKYKFDDFMGIITTYKYHPEHADYIKVDCNKGLEDAPFAKHCFDNWSYEKLHLTTSSLTTGDTVANLEEMKEWDINTEEWEWCIFYALWEKDLYNYFSQIPKQ